MKSNLFTIPSIALAAVMSSCSSGSRAPQKNESRYPNVIFILADDMGYGDLGILFRT